MPIPGERPAEIKLYRRHEYIDGIGINFGFKSVDTGKWTVIKPVQFMCNGIYSRFNVRAYDDTSS
jgi:hypothetical protein